jgi:hypothetical protein
MFWQQGYGSKWEFEGCILHKSDFKELSRADYGIKFIRCEFAECPLHHRHWGWLRKEGPNDDGAATNAADWSTVKQCDFYQCEIAPSIFWSMDQCNCFHCTVEKKADTFQSKTNVIVHVGIAAGDEPLIAELGSKTSTTGTGTVTYAAVPYVVRN